MKKIYDTERVPFIIRLPVLVMGILFLCVAANLAAKHLFGINMGLGLGKESGSPLIGGLLIAALGLILYLCLVSA